MDEKEFVITGKDLSQFLDLLSYLPAKSYDETMAKFNLYKILQEISKKVKE